MDLWLEFSILIWTQNFLNKAEVDWKIRSLRLKQNTNFFLTNINVMCDYDLVDNNRPCNLFANRRCTPRVWLESIQIRIKMQKYIKINLKRVLCLYFIKLLHRPGLSITFIVTLSVRRWLTLTFSPYQSGNICLVKNYNINVNNHVEWMRSRPKHELFLYVFIILLAKHRCENY